VIGAELVIFDCDGVLVDSERVSVGVVQRVLADVGWSLTREEIIERFVGGSKEHFDRQVAERLGRELEDGWDARYSPWYQAAFDEELCAVPGIERAIDELRIPSCVASNSAHHQIRSRLSHVGMLHRFDGRIFSAEDVARGKPAPDVYLLAAATMGVSPDRCVVVEDSTYGVRAARAAGMRVLGYAGGVTPSERLEKEGATTFAAMEDLGSLIGSA
jgi:HAD superfamily hydrolase (TIGR01509 family)